jgi:hypothetical protein
MLFNPSAQFLVAVAATDELINIDLEEEARFDRVNILLVSKEVTDRTNELWLRTRTTVRSRHG